MPILNPFIYGNPVPVEKHINRQRALRTIFSRLQQGESTALVGEPKIGKTSLLHYIAALDVQAAWLGKLAAQLIVLDVELQSWLTPSTKPLDLWRLILEAIEEQVADEAIKGMLPLVKENEYGSATLSNFFRRLGAHGWRVVLLLDEFDALLTHPHFTTAEFLGCLRSISTRSRGLQLVTASILSVSEMNARTEELNPLGSPFFNHFTEIRLKPFGRKDVGELLDTILRGGEIDFDGTDRRFVMWLSGGHPYRVQVAGAALFEAMLDKQPGEKRYTTASAWFGEQTMAHFEALWGRYLDEAAKTVMVILGLVALGGVAQGQQFSFGEIERAERFGPELRRLKDLGLVEQVREGWQWDQNHLLLWQGARWQISAGGFIPWLSDNIIAGNRHIPDFEAWLHNKEIVGYLLTREQWAILRGWVAKTPPGAMKHALKLIKGLFVD